MAKALPILFAFVSLSLHAQYKVFLKNRDTDLPVQYANVWKENKIVATSDSLGVFYVREADSTALFKISALGYETLDSLTVKRTLTALMANTVIALNDVRVVQPKNEKTVKLGKVKSGDVGIVCSREALIPFMAKYFPNDGKQVLFLDRIKFGALSSAKNRIAAITFFSVGADGKPAEPLSQQNLICRFKKGHHTMQIDLKELHLAFPENGIFVVFNYLQLEQNKQYGTTNKEWFFYEPSLDAVVNHGTPDWWNFTKDGWILRDKYSLSMQLVLTN